MRRLASAVMLTLGLIMASPLLGLEGNAPDLHSVVTRAQQRIESADFRASGRLVYVDRKGGRASYPVNLKAHWFPGVLRVLCEINDSRSGSGSNRVHILLEMRQNGQISIRVAHPGDKEPAALPFDHWSESPVPERNAAGTPAGFSYEDLLEPQYFWPGQAVLKETKYGARDCDVLRSTPGAGERTHYASVQSWLDHSIGFPVYVEKFLKGSGNLKEFTYFGLRQNDGVWSASQVEMKVHGQAGSTLLIIDRGSPKANLGLSDFSPEQMIRF